MIHDQMTLFAGLAGANRVATLTPQASPQTCPRTHKGRR